MDFPEFRRVLRAFAQDPSNVDIRMGRAVAEIRDEMIDVTLEFSNDDAKQLIVVENDQRTNARTWLLHRIARLPQLADRIVSAGAPSTSGTSIFPFVTPAGRFSPDLGEKVGSDEEDVRDTVQVLLDKASRAFPGGTSVLYLTSDAGEGKTTVINRAAVQQARAFKERRTSTLIVPIPLSGKAFLTFDDAVIAALVNKLRFNLFYFDGFVELVKMGAIVPAFDGYEEMLVEGSKGEAVSALGNFVQGLDSSGVIFVAARKAFFEYLSLKTQARLLDAIGDRSASFSRLALVRWDKVKFCEYGRLRGCQDPEGIYQTVGERLGETHPVLTRAVLVRRLFDVLEGGADRKQLAVDLGSNPADYFFKFVEAIVKREASEKWLSQASGELLQPLLEIREHHQLLSQIAQEMWQTSTTSLRHDVLDVLVDLFAETQRKSAPVTRQIKERIKQHSLLTADTSRGAAIAFDHEDFRNFYTAEALGSILLRRSQAELQAFLSVGIVPVAAIEQAIQHVVRNQGALVDILSMLTRISELETGFSFCRENCGALALRLLECTPTLSEALVFSQMFFSVNSLSGRKLSMCEFRRCHFQPTPVGSGSFANVLFDECEFERLELGSERPLVGTRLKNCRVESLVVGKDQELTFSPARILAGLRAAGAEIGGDTQPVPSTIVSDPDPMIRAFDRLLRTFMRSTHVDEDLLRVRVGKTLASQFIDQVVPELLRARVLEEVPWRGQGVKRRYKLGVPVSRLSAALEAADGDMARFIRSIVVSQHASNGRD